MGVADMKMMPKCTAVTCIRPRRDRSQPCVRIRALRAHPAAGEAAGAAEEGARARLQCGAEDADGLRAQAVVQPELQGFAAADLCALAHRNHIANEKKKKA